MDAKTGSLLRISSLLLALMLIIPANSMTVLAQTDTPIPTDTPLPTNTPYSRPMMVIQTYRLSVDAVRYGKEFRLIMRLRNAGQVPAYNIQAIFTSSDLIMLGNGGVEAIGNLDEGGTTTFEQAMTAAAPLHGLSQVSVEMTVNYYDAVGTPFSEHFTLYFPVAASGYAATAPSATPTPTAIRQARLVVLRYRTDVDPLQPGALFTLEMVVKNVGTASAKGVTMIIGGGSASAGGTPQVGGGISGGGGEFTNFAPVDSSNVQLLGDLAPEATLEASQRLIVNVSTNPGAYPMKITFSYLNDQGNVINDEQVITLLVASLPVVDIGFYQSLSPWMVGQPNLLPLQIVNLGKRTAVLGKVRVQVAQGSVENGEMLVGSLDPGGYFTMDVMVFPEAAGTLDLQVTIEYTDDFNQPRLIEKTLSVEVLEATPELPPEGEAEGAGFIPTSETFLEKLWRFLLGLFGLDSSRHEDAQPTSVPIPESEPIFPGGKY